MIEVEVKLPIFRRSITERALRELNFETGPLVKESDIYFTSSFHDFMELDEALRIRTTENFHTRESKSVITFKGPKLDQISMTRKELETGVEDESIVKEILLSIGFQELAPVIKLRQYYKKENITACVDSVEGLGTFLELEILVPSEDDREAALKQIEEILWTMDSSMKETTRVSYLSMLQRKSKKHADPTKEGM